MAIRTLLARCENAQDARTALRALRKRCPNVLTRTCLLWLNENAMGEREETIRAWLLVRSKYMSALFDPALLPQRGAVKVGRLLCPRDPHFGFRLYAYCHGEPLQPEQKIHLLNLIDQLELVDRTIFLVREFSRDADPGVRAIAAGIFCKSRPNKGNIVRQLASTEGRVRATAIEALWNCPSGFALVLLRQAVHDPVPRVAANAVLGLYYAGAPELVPLLKSMLTGASVHMCRSLTWAMGKMSNSDVAEMLRELASSEHRSVRIHAQLALKNQPLIQKMELPEPVPQPEPCDAPPDIPEIREVFRVPRFELLE